MQSRIGKEVQYRPSIGKIKLLVKGEVAWQAAHKFKPSSNVLMVLGERDSIQHHVDQACLPNPLFYATHFVPIGLSTVPKNLIGESKITLDGIN
jgi:hypothetical protein